MPIFGTVENSIATITLSRPKARNAWDEDYNEGLQRLLADYADRDEVRCVVLTGDETGGAFSAGANIADPQTHTTGSAADFIKSIGKWRKFVTHLFEEFPKPIVAAVNGYAIGVGCIATYSCDLIVASERAEWRSPQTSLGILPAYGGSVRLARWVGRGAAMRMAMGFPLAAREAFDLGLAQWLVPHGDLMDKARAVASHIAALPPLAVRMTKESLIRGLDIANIADASLVDTYRFMLLEGTADKDEAHRAWRERRQPNLTGL